MNEKPFSTLQNAFLSLGVLIFVVVILYFGKTVLVPVCLAVLLAFVLTPVVIWLEHRGLRRVYAVLLSVFLAVSFLAGIFSIVATEVRMLAIELPKHKENITQKLAPVYRLVDRIQSFRDIGSELRSLQAPSKQQRPTERPVPVVIEGESGSTALAWVPTIAHPLMEFLGDALLVVVLVAFMLVGRENLRNRLIRLASHGQLTNMTKAMDEATQRVSRYLISQLGTNSLVGVGAGVAMTFIGVPYAFLWGLLTIALRFIPYIGVWIAAILPFLLSVVIFPSWTQPLMVLGAYLTLELITFNAIEPLLFGHNTGVSPLALLIVAVFWMWLWGPIGLLLSTPMTVCLVVAGKYVPYLDFFDVLLGDEPVLELPVRFYQRLLAKDAGEAAQLLQEYLQAHPLERVYDDIFLSALVRAKKDRLRGELDGDDSQFLLQTLRDLLRTNLPPRERVARLANGQLPPESGGAVPTSAVAILGCPVDGDEDELALEVFRHVVEPEGWWLEIVPTARLQAIATTPPRDGKVELICLASLPPGGLVRMRGLARRLQVQLPKAKVVVGRWGQTTDIDAVKGVLRNVGVENVATTLIETRDQIRTLINQPAPTPPRQETPEPAKK